MGSRHCLLEDGGLGGSAPDVGSEDAEFQNPEPKPGESEHVGRKRIEPAQAGFE